MAENKMKEVAKLLGVELEEEFRIEGYWLKYKLTKNDLKYWSDDLQQWRRSIRVGQLLTGEKKIIKLPKPILDDIEKEYLSAVIKPFKNRIISIRKIEDPGEECIVIYMEHFRDKANGETFILPSFEKKTMYKGMKTNRRYTLEELGL